MASSLLDIPGARRGGGPQRPDRGPARADASLLFRRPPLPLDRRHRPPWGHTLHRARRAQALKVVVAVMLLVGLVALWRWWRTTMVTVDVAPGSAPLALPPDRTAEAPFRFAVQGGGAVTVTLSGVSLDEVVRSPGADGGDVIEVRLPGGLPEGGYDLAVTVRRPIPLASTTGHWAVFVDGRPPALAPPAPLDAVAIDGPVTLTGTVEEGAVVTSQGSGGDAGTVVTEGGVYRVAFARPPVGTVTLSATDAAGNRSEVAVVVPVRYPLGLRAVHVTAAGWADRTVHDAIVAQIQRGEINAVQLDIKDESGVVGHDTAVQMAYDIGAVQAQYRLADAVAELDALGVRIVGRIVAFRDPVLADWAWENGQRAWVVQNPDGTRYADYGGFTNYAVKEVRDYNLALAQEAGAAGFDDILWDYVRRPEGDPDSMFIPGLTGTTRTTGDEIVDFLAQGHQQLRALGVYQGASVFGISATRPENIGQPIDRISRVVDYVAPMVYPSHYNDGECGVASPIRQPYDIVACSLGDFVEAMAGGTAVLVPWLQDFTLGSVSYGPAEVMAQIRASESSGGAGFLLWNPNATYSRLPSS